MSRAIQDAQCIVIKVGSTLVTNRGQGLDHEAIGRWAAQMAELRSMGKQVVMVSSGAIAEGVQRLGWSKRPTDIHELQAAAAVGQMGLVQVYETSFAKYGKSMPSRMQLHHRSSVVGNKSKELDDFQSYFPRRLQLAEAET